MKALSDALSWPRVAAILILGAALAWAGARLDWSQIGRNLSSADPSLIAAMAAIWSVGLLIRPIRMLLLIRASVPVPWRQYWTVWSADVIALVANSIAPMRAGDILIPFLLRRALETRAAQLFPVVMVDRLFDFVTVVLLFVLTLGAAPIAVSWAGNVTIALLAVLVTVVVGFWLAIHKHELWISLLDSLAARIGRPTGTGWIATIRDLLSSFAAIDRMSIVIPALLLSIVLWMVTAVAYWLGAVAIFQQTSLVGMAFATAAVALSFVVPITPGGVGVFHATMVLALTLFGVPAEAALASAIIIHTVLLCTAFVLAAIALNVQRMSVRALTQRLSAASPDGRPATPPGC